MGDLTADFAPVVGNLTPRFVKSPVVGHEIDKCIKRVHDELFVRKRSLQSDGCSSVARVDDTNVHGNLAQ